MPDDTLRDSGQLLELLQFAVREASGAGAEYADAAAGSTRDIAVEVDNNSVKSAEAELSEAMTIRAFFRGGRGMVTINGRLNEDGIRQAARDAAALARQANPDPDFKSLPKPDSALFEQVPGLYDEAVAALGAAEVMAAVGDNLTDGLAAVPDAVFQGSVGAHAGTSALANSLGIAVASRSTFYDLGFSALLKRGGEVGMFYEMAMGRRLKDVDPHGVARKAALEAEQYVGGASLPSGTMDLVLGPMATYSFIAELASHCNAESIQRRRSFMAGRQGETIAAPCLTLWDNGLIEAGMSSGAWDGEGARRRRTPLIERGRFEGMLHNSYTAGKAGVANTGHGSMGGGVSPTNVQIELGEASAADILADTRSGIYINYGALSPDSASGDVSASIDFGRRIENGRLTHPVTNAMIAGTIFDILKAVDAVSKDYRAEPGLRLPTIRIRGVQVIGSGG